MKKHTLAMGVTAVFIFAVTAYMKNRAYVSDDLLTANVEALARKNTRIYSGLQK